MKRTYVYRKDKSGNVRPLLLTETIPYVHNEGTGAFEDRMRRNLYDMECKEGSRFKGCQEFSPSFLKKVWVDNVERDNHRDARRDEAMARAQQTT